MGSEDDSLRIPTHERMGSLATSQASARRFLGVPGFLDQLRTSL
jgi:hypothetical protein